MGSESDFDGQFLGDVLAVLLTKWGLSVATHQLDPETLSQLAAGALFPDQVTGGAPRLSLFDDSTNPTDTAFDIGVEFFPLPETATDKPGFALLPFATGTFDAGTEVTDKLTLEVRGTADLTGGVGVFVRPNKDVTFLSSMDSGAPAPVTGDLSLVLDLATPGDPIVILGTPGGTGSRWLVYRRRLGPGFGLSWRYSRSSPLRAAKSSSSRLPVTATASSRACCPATVSRLTSTSRPDFRQSRGCTSARPESSRSISPRT